MAAIFESDLTLTCLIIWSLFKHLCKRTNVYIALIYLCCSECFIYTILQEEKLWTEVVIELTRKHNFLSAVSDHLNRSRKKSFVKKPNAYAFLLLKKEEEKKLQSRKKIKQMQITKNVAKCWLRILTSHNMSQEKTSTATLSKKNNFCTDVKINKKCADMT